MTAIWWIRRDLRMIDNPALNDAAAHGAVLPLFVHDPALDRAGAPRRSRLEASLVALAEATGKGAVVKRGGDPRDVVVKVAQEIGASSVHVTGEYTPFAVERDREVAGLLGSAGVAMRAHGSPYAVRPGSVLTGGGTPYRVFTPFAKAWREQPVEPPHETAAVDWVHGVDSEPFDADLLRLAERFGPAGEHAALARWQEFLDNEIDTYADDRDRPDLDRTSRLSVHLRHGEIHPRRLLRDIADRRSSTGSDSYVNELAWREFYADVLWHRPDSLWNDLRPLPMDYDEGDDLDELVDAWRLGRTGFPFVDAGMRQLRQTGWMHNRVRMVTASFLIKDLHVRWQTGARHFLDQLLDGDVASNNHSWQWVAGTGTDAAPYFRIFNPVMQGKRFDPAGDYVRRWIPELTHLKGVRAHEPWKQADGYQHEYSQRIVDHDEERRESLERYDRTRGETAP